MDKARRAALKAAYKEKVPRAGIVQVRNLKNGKRYIRGTSDVDAFMTRMRFQLERGADMFSRGLQDDWRVFGADAFVIEVLDLVKDVEKKDANKIASETADMEKLYCEEYQCYGENGYNRPPIS